MFSVICARAFFRQTRLMDCLEEADGGDGQTVLNFAGTGTAKFSGGLFRGVNSCFGGTGITIFLVGLFRDGWG